MLDFNNKVYLTVDPFYELQQSCSDPGVRLFQDDMREIQLGSHTVQSHGVILAKSHKHDWVILIFLAFLVLILNVMHPFHRFVSSDMMTDLKYPLKSNSVPVWAVPVCFLLSFLVTIS